ncbi:hypothetical protein [Micromonospora sp. NPDC005652]|uniref:hypothetical protein n=1 Tax=Micromonospora sp. NPDC005652 TaxID=3157046 RepID=UPI0033EF54B4
MNEDERNALTVAYETAAAQLHNLRPVGRERADRALLAGNNSVRFESPDRAAGDLEADALFAVALATEVAGP